MQRVKLSIVIAGDAYEFEGTLAEIDQELSDFTDYTDQMFEKITSIKQVGLVKGVVTNTNTAATATTPVTTSKGGPPGLAVPECKHGKMLDLRKPDGSRGVTSAGKEYGADFYCSYKGKDWQNKCKPKNVGD